MDKKPLPRWLIAAAALPLCAAVIFLLLWLNPHKIYAYRAQTASADEAVKTCPFALITQEEFELDPDATRRYTDLQFGKDYQIQ